MGRWEKSETLPNAEAKQYLVKLKEIGDLAHMVYTPPGVQEFLSTPMAIFDGYTALDLIRLNQHERVKAQLASDYEGLGY